jgi:predicted nucleotide-binding protein (sugar kinase/HSP70/actin superfamily)
MNKIKNPYLDLSNEELIDFAIEEMDKLKILSYRENMEEYEKGIKTINQLIIEIKRRNLSLNNQRLRSRILL